MSIIKPEYRFLAPKGKYLADTVVLAQAWKKTQHYVRHHNWYADGLELDVTMANLERHLSEWGAAIRKRDFQTYSMRLVPAPKNARWEFKPPPEMNWENILEFDFNELGPEPIFKDWVPCEPRKRSEANDSNGSVAQKLRPLAHLTIRDQTLATAVMMCLAEAVETAQGNPSSNDETNTVSFGNRLQCRWIKTAESTERAEFSWGNKSSYRKYFQDYRSFLARPRKACAEASASVSRGKDLYVVSLDIKSFYDQIDIKALLGELKRIESEHAQRFALSKEQQSSSLFWSRTAKILDWRWHEADQSQAPLIHEGEVTLKVGLPQGLMASGFFANAYMLGFDAAMKQAAQSVIDKNGEIVLIDYCRYVDDLRLVVTAPHQFSSAGQEGILKQIEEYVKQQLKDHCDRIGVEKNKALQLSPDKSDISAYRAATTSGSLSNLMELLNAELSGPFDFESLTQAAGGLEGLLWMAEQIDAVVPDHSRLKLSAIAAPPAEVRDDTLKRFVASRLAQSLRQRLAMTAPATLDSDDGLLMDLVLEGRAVSHEFEATARKLIKCWAENPSLALLLRTGLDLFPHPRLLLPVLEALSVKLFASSSHDSPEDLRQIRSAEYVAADLLRAGCQETGLRPAEDYPEGVDVLGYREELAAFAHRIVAERDVTPWYLLQQAALYLAVMGDFSLSATTAMEAAELSEHRTLAKVMRYEPVGDGSLLDTLPAALVAQQITPNSRRFGRWVQDGLKRTFDEQQQRLVIATIAMNRPDLLEHVLFSRTRAASEWKKYAPPAMRERPRKAPFFSSKQGSSPINLFAVMQSPENPFRQENGLLILAHALLQTETLAQMMNEGLAVTDIRISCKDWSRIYSLPSEEGFLQLTLDQPEPDPCYLYKKPDWVADDKAWLYAFGRILRAAMTGEADFTTRRYILTEEVSRYRGLMSSWSSRRIGLLNSAQGLIDEPSPISPWLSGLISGLLQWPGIEITADVAARAMKSKTPGELARIIEARITEQRALFGRRSDTPIYAIPVDETAALQARSMRIAVVQPMRPLLSDFDLKDPTHWTPVVLAQHRRHLAEVCRLASQSLRTWHSSKFSDGTKDSSPVVDIVLFPELSVHPEHVFLLRRLADDLKASIFAGLTFLDSTNLSAPINQGLWLLRSETIEQGRSFQYIWQGKKYPTEFERKMGVKSHRPHITLVEFPIGEKSATRIAAAICYDATDLDLAADLRDRSDIFMVAALNKDVQTFDNMVSALNFHMYQPVVLANSGEFGGSAAQAPLPKHERLITHLHGNNQVGVSVFEIDPTPFKSTKAGKALKELKTSPAGYSGRPV